MRLAWGGALLFVVVAAVPAQAQTDRPTSCVACHSNEDFFEAEAVAVVADFQQDVHAAAGLSCHDCHGGNPDPELAEDIDAMDPSFADGAYVGAPDREAIPGFCARCHADIEYMRRFDPRARVDQLEEYRTSHHGRALARGDSRVATCVDCHGTHGIRGPEDPASPVHPAKVAETCQRCHADADVMRGSLLPDGRPLPVDQYARWRQSVHAAALLDREDLSAPTCNDCHGNHGATPPGLHSISFVCGQCHGREAEVFRSSAKWEGFELHNELIPEAGEEGCAACHDSLPETAEAAVGHGLTECSTCHDHHAVVRPTLAMLTPLPEAPCAFCHELPGSEEGEILEPEQDRELYLSMKEALLAQAGSLELDGDARFDWLVDQALQLPTHTIETPGEDSGRTLKPEFERLLVKFRIGKTHFTYADPTTGEPVRGEIVRCGSCHPDDGAGLEMAQGLLHQMRELTARTARAERILLRARRGGVHTQEAELEVDQAVDAQIALQVAVHAFGAESSTSFDETHSQGMAHARTALEAGQAALDELHYRRLGLGVSLIFIVLVLVALAMKIRELPA